MYSETSELDKAERGECQEYRSRKGETSRQVNGESPQRISQPLHQTQDPVAHAQCDDIGERHFVPEHSFPADDTLPEQACGPFGLAQVKNYDRRFAFYPGFAVERSLALEFRAEGISQLSMKIKNLMKELDSVDASKPKSQLLVAGEEELPVLMSRLAESVAQYGRNITPTIDPTILQLMLKSKTLPGCMGR